ncbi:GntR family transcriptional regulator [Brachybacterium sp. YJGR34]|uniref:GntR family transcriptional regulator n=1 Tax=Brachybacterium sp. YJGR34 TaxID=2059911 RepID=UPI000E0C5B76|nr:GntR family transcriptional regulator [Brachybacterium sp. YJGR34]
MIIVISPESGSPARQIHDQISGLITTGQLGQGERLPSVRQLASDLGVAPGTVAKAYRSLEADGLLVSRAGSGTRVSDQAAPVSSAVAQAARRLAGTARREGLSLEQTLRVLRSTW